MTDLSFLEEMHRRGAVRDVSDSAGLHHHLETGRRRAYVGFDPTSDSLTVGNLLALMLLRAFQRHGHVPVLLSGGGTGLIGDPSGKSLERPLLSPDEVAANVAGQRRVFERLLDFDGAAAAVVVNNLDWLGGMGFLDALRDIGKHLSVFSMFAKESVRSRQAEGGSMSYAEFSYQVLQSYDFAHLYRYHGVTVQMGGSDQWGNITTGLELIRKLNRSDVSTPEAFGLTSPLLLDSAGNKMGKSEIGAIWLTADRTSPYQMFQYFLNLPDVDAAQLLPKLTDLPLDDVAEVLASAGSQPAARVCQQALAEGVVALLHGDKAALSCRSASRAMFGGDIRELTESELEMAFAHVPSTEFEFGDQQQLDLITVLDQLGIAASRTRIRQLLGEGAIHVNGSRVALGHTIHHGDLLFGRFLIVRRGAKNWYVGRVQQ